MVNPETSTGSIMIEKQSNEMNKTYQEIPSEQGEQCGTFGAFQQCETEDDVLLIRHHLKSTDVLTLKLIIGVVETILKVKLNLP